jgi:hypothetical protein
MTSAVASTIKKKRTKAAEVKNDFIQTTYLLLEEQISMQEYVHGFLNVNLFRKPHRKNTYYIVLLSCPRKPGALRELGERVTTYVASCASPFIYWMDTMCSGNQSFVEPTMLIGPFDSSLRPIKDVLGEVKQSLLHTRGLGDRIVRLSTLARTYGVFTLTCIPPILPSSELDKIYTNVATLYGDGIFERPSDASGSTRSTPLPAATRAAQ